MIHTNLLRVINSTPKPILKAKTTPLKHEFTPMALKVARNTHLSVYFVIELSQIRFSEERSKENHD